MYTTLTSYDFINAFGAYGRGTQFSYDGLDKLFDYLEELEQDTGIDIELDVIGLCCDYTEYGSLEEFRQEHGDEYESIEDIGDVTQVIMLDNGRFIIENF